MFERIIRTGRQRISQKEIKASLTEKIIATDSAADALAKESLAPYNAYSGEGEVTGALVYVNQGVPEDYEVLERRGVDVKGKIVLARYGGSWRGIKAKVADHARLTLAYADAASDPFDLVSGLNVEVGARRFAVGAEYDMHVDEGDVTLSFAYGQTTGRTKGGAAGEAFRNQQFVFGASYARPLGQGFTAILAANKFLGDFDPDAGFSTAPARAALVQRYDGSPFSVGLTLAYVPVEHVTIHVTYASEDSVLGLGRADNTVSFGLRAVF